MDIYNQIKNNQNEYWMSKNWSIFIYNMTKKNFITDIIFI